MPEHVWQKSSFSGSGENDCIEVANGATALHLRESDEPGVVLSAERTVFRSLVSHLKAAHT